MKQGFGEFEIKAWRQEGLLLETYQYTIGKTEPLPGHVHAEYQFSFSPNQVGEYNYRRGKHRIPVGQLSVLHSGEPHTTSERRFHDVPSFYRMLYIEPDEMMALVEEISGGKNPSYPFFPQVVIDDPVLTKFYLRLFRYGAEGISQLEKDGAKLDFFTRLLTKQAQNKISPDAFRKCPATISRAAEFLHANYDQSVSLDELAGIAGAGKFYLCRAFAKSFGVTPHAYQTHLRISRAKKLLLGGVNASQAAIEVGFYDQSHFSHCFKKVVGVSPVVYSTSKSGVGGPPCEESAIFYKTVPEKVAKI